MTEILKRYFCRPEVDCAINWKSAENGTWVLYGDVKNTIESLQQQNERLQDDIDCLHMTVDLLNDSNDKQRQALEMAREYFNQIATYWGKGDYSGKVAEEALTAINKALGGNGMYNSLEKEMANKHLSEENAKDLKNDCPRCKFLHQDIETLVELNKKLANATVKKMDVRQEVKLFAEAMEKVLRENDDKSGWKECSPAWLLIMLEDEAKEIRELISYHRHTREAISQQERIRLISKECCDVANFAMMLADVYGALGGHEHE